MFKRTLDDGLVPWRVEPADAVAAMAELSPELGVQRKAESAKAAPMGKGSAADVHAGIRALIEEAVDTEALQAMPPIWQAWL